MLGRELFDRPAADKPVQGADHGGAFAGRMIGGAVQCMGQEELGALCLCDDFVQLRDLLTDGLAPLRAGSVEDSGRGVEGQPQPVCDLDEGQPTELFGSIHSPAGLPRPRAHQPAFVVVPQRRRAHPKLGRGFADRNQIHAAI